MRQADAVAGSLATAMERRSSTSSLSPRNRKASGKPIASLRGNPALNGAFRHELTGHLDAALWEEAYNELARRHEALRATVRIVDGEPMLAIADKLKLSLVSRDLRELLENEREAEMERLCTR